jgi:putative endonuclease
MAIHNELGKTGEDLAVQYFTAQGYSILFRNWRYKHEEIDVIAVKNGILHFIEVKTRSNSKFGLPEESINRKKLRSFLNAAQAFLHRHAEWKRIQFDVLSISMVDGKAAYFLIEDVYL